MHKAAMIALLAIFAALAGTMMLSAGEHPAFVVLVLGGVLLFVVRGNAVVDRGRLRRGKAVDFSAQLDDLVALTRRDWQELGITLLVSIALASAGALAFGRGSH